MSDIPKVSPVVAYWSPSEDDFMTLNDDGSAVSWALGGEYDGLPADALPLVPQASRDELREAIADTVAYLVEDMREVDIPDAIVDVLTERGHVRPEGGEQRG